MGRTPSCDQNGLKKGTWTTEEDRKLIAYVTRYGCWNWRQLPKFAGLERCGKSCRLRWMNYLRPNIKRGNYSKEEEELIITLHEKLGNKWSVIATHLPGRTDNEIKNHWHTKLKKRSQKKTTFTHEQENNESGSKQDKDLEQNNVPMSPPISSTEFSSTTTDPTTAVTTENLVIEDEYFDFLDSSNIEILNENLWTESYAGGISFPTIETVPENGDSYGYANFQGSDGTEVQTTIENFWLEPFMDDMAHVPNDLLTPFVTESDEYFSTLYGIDLWNQNVLHDEPNSFF